MDVQNLSYTVNGKIVNVSATVDGINYNNITPKFFSNREIFNSDNISLTYYNANDLTYKSQSYITPGVNAIDIDWNGVSINDNPNINSTSDLIKLLIEMDTDVSGLDDGRNYWMNYNPNIK